MSAIPSNDATSAGAASDRPSQRQDNGSPNVDVLDLLRQNRTSTDGTQRSGQDTVQSLSLTNIYNEVGGGASNARPGAKPFETDKIDDSQQTRDLLNKQQTELGGLSTPNIGDLRSQYPDAGLPANMIGTTITGDIMYALPIDHPPSAQQQQQLNEYADDIMKKCADMNLNTVRLGAYMDQIMKDPNNPNYAELDAFLGAAQKYGISVVLTVGEKAPGYPEYYYPGYVPGSDKSSNGHTPPNYASNAQQSEQFVQNVADHIAANTTDSGTPGIGNAVSMWQVENEPYNKAGSDNFWLDSSQVNQEISILRNSDNRRRPLMETFWSDNDQLQRLNQAFENPDIDAVGIDVYSRTGNEPQNGPDSSADRIRTQDIPQYVNDLSRATGKPAMIAELQADPWAGPNDQIGKPDSRNFVPTAQSVEDLYAQERSIGFQDMLFWRLDANLRADTDAFPGTGLGNDARTSNPPQLTADQILNLLENSSLPPSSITTAESDIAATYKAGN